MIINNIPGRIIMKNMKKEVLKSASKLLFMTAEKEENSACLLFAYQPKAPKELKKLRKF